MQQTHGLTYVFFSKHLAILDKSIIGQKKKNQEICSYGPIKRKMLSGEAGRNHGTARFEIQKQILGRWEQNVSNTQCGIGNKRQGYAYSTLPANSVPRPVLFPVSLCAEGSRPLL